VIVGRAAPADAEAQAAFRAAGLVTHDETIGTLAQAFLGDDERLRSADVDGRAVHRNVAAGAAPAPLPAIEIPIIAPAFAHHLPPDAARRRARALRVDRDQLERRGFARAGARAFERGLEAEIDVRQAHGRGDALAHDAPARIGDGDDDVGAQRQR